MNLKAVRWALVVGLAACSSTPDTPENAVMDYLTSAQVGRSGEARGLACKRLRDDEAAWKSEAMDRLLGASVFGDGLEKRQGDTATVRLEVLFPPSEPGAVGEPWVAHLVKEPDGWKVCGFERSAR